MFKIHRFHNAQWWTILCVLVSIALELLLGTRVWYLVRYGFFSPRYDTTQDFLPWVISIAIALLAAGMFMGGGYAVAGADAFDRTNGRFHRFNEVTKQMERYNRPSTAWCIHVVQWIILCFEWWAIIYMSLANYGVLGDRVGYIGAFLFLSFLPPLLGKISYAMVNKPVHLLAADATRAIQLQDLSNQVDAATKQTRQRRHQLAPLGSSEQPFSVSEISAPQRDRGSNQQAFPKALPQGGSQQSSVSNGSQKQPSQSGGPGFPNPFGNKSSSDQQRNNGQQSHQRESRPAELDTMIFPPTGGNNHGQPL